MNCLACIHAQSYPVLGSPIDCSPPGSSVHGILQARALEWVAISSSRGFFWPRDQTHISCVSCIRRQILYHWAPWKPQELLRRLVKTLVSGPHPQSFWLGRLLVRYDHLHWHHWCSGHELGQTLGDGAGQGGLVCYSPWGREESDTPGWLNNYKMSSLEKCLFRPFAHFLIRWFVFSGVDLCELLVLLCFSVAQSCPTLWPMDSPE